MAQFLNGAIAQLALQANHELLTDPPVRVEVPVELENMVDSIIHILGDGEEAEIVGRNQALTQKVSSQEFGPALPVGSFYFVDQDDWYNSGLTSLHQGQTFETFIHRSKAAGKQCDGVRFLNEIHFSSKKIIEIYQFRIAINGLVGFLLEWQPDVKTEAVLSTGSALGGAHNPVTASSDDHVSAFAHQSCESFRGLVDFDLRAGSRRTENRYLTDSLIWGKSLGGLSEFFQRTIDQLEVRYRYRIAPHAKGRDNHFCDQLMRIGNSPILNHFLDASVEFRVP